LWRTVLFHAGDKGFQLLFVIDLNVSEVFCVYNVSTTTLFLSTITPKLLENSGTMGFRENIISKNSTHCVKKMLNRNKQDINSYVNSVDLERYLGYLRFDYPFIYRHSDLPWDVNDMFRGNNTHAIILLDDHPSGVGHYVCLRKDAVDNSGVSTLPGSIAWQPYAAGCGREVPEAVRGVFPGQSTHE
jgi:hypothetical protein